MPATDGISHGDAESRRFSDKHREKGRGLSPKMVRPNTILCVLGVLCEKNQSHAEAERQEDPPTAIVKEILAFPEREVARVV